MAGDASVRKVSDGELLARLFSGRRDIYGINKGCVERKTVGDWPSETWDRLFEEHVAGNPEADLGIYLVRDDDTVTFCCVDIDEPNFDLAREVAETMPTDHAWIEKSRSGNFHVWAFFDEPLEAWAARAVLRGVIVAVGQPALELFPKQGGLREGMVGNYVSIPWHGTARPIVWGKAGWGTFEEDGAPRRWLLVADRERTSAEAWRRRGRALGGKPRAEGRSGEFGARNSLHICAEYIFKHRDDNPLVPGHRATVLFNLSKMYANCAHYSEEEAIQFVQAVNEAGTAPVPLREVERFVHNAFSGGFTSTGCDEGAMSAYVSPSCPIVGS